MDVQPNGQKQSGLACTAGDRFAPSFRPFRQPGRILKAVVPLSARQCKSGEVDAAGAPDCYLMDFADPILLKPGTKGLDHGVDLCNCVPPRVYATEGGILPSQPWSAR